jgi:hypothetical protein
MVVIAIHNIMPHIIIVIGCLNILLSTGHPRRDRNKNIIKATKSIGSVGMYSPRGLSPNS